ncbi:MAG: SUMF1/EgtB/PvdO family nonheme iron enzyme [Ardenticatenales bacterium]|nr:SUMF1/EgtB/PvdO family nonheme iron enzyme [Ardenticatenales bacterium]
MTTAGELSARDRIVVADPDVLDREVGAAPTVVVQSVAETLAALHAVIRRDTATVVLTAAHVRLAAQHKPADLTEHRLGRIAEWSQPRYRLDGRFVCLTLLVDQGEENAAGRWAARPERYNSLGALLAAVAEPAVVVLGPPGSGKSTLLRRLELDRAIAALRHEDPSDTVTFFVQLNQYKASEPGQLPPPPARWLAERWADRYPSLPPLDVLLAEGRMVLLLDALNEMPAASGARVPRTGAGVEGLAESSWPGPVRATASCSVAARSTMRRRFRRRRCGCRRCSSSRSPTIRCAPSCGSTARYAATTSGRRSPGRRSWRPSGPRSSSPSSSTRSSPRASWAATVPACSRASCARRCGARSNATTRCLRTRTSWTVGIPPHRALAVAGRVPAAGARRAAAAAGPAGVRDAGDGHRRRNRPGSGGLRRGARPGGPSARCRHRQSGRGDQRAGRGPGGGRGAVPSPAVAGVLRGAGAGERAEPGARRGAVADRRHPARPARDPRRAAARRDAADAPPDGLGGDDDPGCGDGTRPGRFLRALMPCNLIVAGRAARLQTIGSRLSAAMHRDLCTALVGRSRDPAADLRHRIACGHAVGDLGDPRFERRTGPHGDFLVPPLVPVPGGTYQIGDDGPLAWSVLDVHGTTTAHVPRHEVALASYEIGQFPVTNAEYACFMAAGGYDDERWWTTDDARRWRRGDLGNTGQKANDWIWRRRFLTEPGLFDQMESEGRFPSADVLERWRAWLTLDEEAFELALDDRWPAKRETEPRFWGDERFNRPTQPVVGLCWYEARAYCAWLSAQMGRDLRLPTEVEWEAAARGRDGRAYPWGDAWDRLGANTNEARVWRTTPVGVFVEGDSPFGVADMAGNTTEWTASLFGGSADDSEPPQFPYPYDTRDGREEPAAPSSVCRVLRGGEWSYVQGNARCAYRGTTCPTSGWTSRGSGWRRWQRGRVATEHRDRRVGSAPWSMPVDGRAALVVDASILLGRGDGCPVRSADGSGWTGWRDHTPRSSGG